MSADTDEAAERAARELERRLRSYVPDANRLLLARLFIADLLGERWRPPLRTAPVPARPADPGTTHRGAEMARTALADARRGGTTEGAA